MKHRQQRGQALLEFALVIPLFLTLLVGIIDLGRVVWATDSLANAAREGARFAIVHGGVASDPCPVGPLSPLVSTPVAVTASCPYPGPSVQSIVDVATSAAILGGSGITVTVSYGGSGDDSRGNPVTVAVTSHLDLVLPSLLHLGTFTVTGTSTMLVNH